MQTAPQRLCARKIWRIQNLRILKGLNILRQGKRAKTNCGVAALRENKFGEFKTLEYLKG